MVARRALASALQQGGRAGQRVFSEELFEEICDRLATGESLRAICRDPHMPDEKAVRKWVTKDAAELGPQFTHAREMGYESLAEEVVEISDQPCLGPDGFVDNGAVQRARLMADSRKWFLSKQMPKKYGDKVTQEITGEDGGALITRIELVPVAARPRPQIEHDVSDGSRPAANRSSRKPKQP
jgi:hypothetical protein